MIRKVSPGMKKIRYSITSERKRAIYP